MKGRSLAEQRSHRLLVFLSRNLHPIRDARSLGGGSSRLGPFCSSGAERMQMGFLCASSILFILLLWTPLVFLTALPK